ncbi:MAG TPA: glycosyl hydrolase family 28-related protein [Acidobacteriaceae bacterium]|nr:glycosyl hydrolase family 28-related protein [Acidobacteriaceae bacterium]
MTIDELRFASRRNLLGLGAAAGVAALFDSRPAAAAAATGRIDAMAVNVRNYRAAGDGKTDDTAAFQRAMDSVGKAGGGTVYAPPGKYLFRGSLTVPGGVTLRGSYGCVPSHPGMRRAGGVKSGDDGTALLVTGGKGSEDGMPFLTLQSNSTVAGLVIYYPDQIVDSEPAPYPWCIAMQGVNPAVVDVELLNPYQGINTAGAARHNVRNVTGQPLRRGIFVDKIYDIGRIENVHFNPWWSMGTPVYEWQFANGEAFTFGRSDWEYVFNTFCFGYHIGYRFIQTPAGLCNGNFLGIGADDCNRAVLVEQSAPYGILITNGEFTAFHGDDPTMVEVLPANKGVLRFSNTAFWGPCNQIAKIDGTGAVGFNDCTFVQWGKEGNRAAVQAAGGSVLIRGCEFLQAKPHVHLGENVTRAVISGNLFAGAAQIENLSKRDVQIGLNAASA